MKNILLVEDDAEITGLLNLYFSSQAYNLVSAADGETAKKKIADKSYDLIILDITHTAPGAGNIKTSEDFSLAFSTSEKIL
ncbi:MAG: response regulator [Segetibacter sp.]